MSDIAPIDSPAYGISRHLAGVSFDDAVERATAALKANGFGVLTTIDIQGTLKAKLDADTRPYTILGACNPKMAHRALQAEGGIGLLLPCNVVVAGDGNGGSVVSAIDPVAMFSVVGRDDIEPIAGEVKSMLQAAIDAV